MIKGGDEWPKVERDNYYYHIPKRGRWEPGFKRFSVFWDYFFWLVVIIIFLFGLNRMIPAPMIFIYIYWITVVIVIVLAFFKIVFRGE